MPTIILAQEGMGPVFDDGLFIALGLGLLIAVLCLLAIFAAKRKNKARPWWALAIGALSMIFGIRALIQLVIARAIFAPAYWLALVPIVFGAVCLVDKRSASQFLSLVAGHKIAALCIALILGGCAIFFVRLMWLRNASGFFDLVAVLPVAVGIAGLIISHKPTKR